MMASSLKAQQQPAEKDQRVEPLIAMSDGTRVAPAVIGARQSA
jgi:hypothetical protein